MIKDEMEAKLKRKLASQTYIEDCVHALIQEQSITN